MKANVWEGRNESDWSIFPDWFTGEKLGQKFDDGHTGPKFDQNGLKSVKSALTHLLPLAHVTRFPA